MSALSKEELRKAFLKMRVNFDSKKIEEYSDIVSKSILSHYLYNEMKNIMVYISFKNEVNLKYLIEQSWMNGKNIFIPKTNIVAHTMQPYQINSWDDTIKGNYNLIEPKNNLTPFPIDEIELVLVPGIVFDRKGNRLGYGGGYYDRFFSQFIVHPFRIGVCYEFQLIDNLPSEQHDLPMNEIVTEESNIII